MHSLALGRLLSTLALVLPAAAQNAVLNGPLARRVVNQIEYPRTSPDGRFHTYALDRDGDGALELYSNSAHGAHSPRLLASSLLDGASRWITLDSSNVILPADLDGDGLWEINRIPIDGTGAPKNLGGAYPLRTVRILGESAASGRIVYLQGTTAFELFSLPLDGGTPARLNDPLSTGGGVHEAKLLGTDRVAFLANKSSGEPILLFAALADGSAPPIRLPISLVDGGMVSFYQPSPDGARVFYVADPEEAGRIELYSIASDGSTPPQKLNGPLVPGGTVGRWVHCPPPGPPYCTSHFDASFLLSPNGQWIVYAATQEQVERSELYSVPADGSTGPVKLSSLADRSAFPLFISRDSSWVIFKDPFGELFSAPLDGSEPQRTISPPPPLGGSVLLEQGSVDGRRVVFAATQGLEAPLELFSTPVDGSAPPVRLNAPLPNGGSLSRGRQYPPFAVFDHGVVYQADQEVDELQELYLVPVEGGAAPHKLVAGPVDDFLPSVSGAPTNPILEQVLLRRQGKLVEVDLAGTLVPELLDELPLGDVAGSVRGFWLTPSGDRALYLAQEQDNLAVELHSVPSDKPSLRVNVRLGPQPKPVVSMQLVPDGTRVVFQSSADLFSAPADGSAAPINGSVEPPLLFQISPDGQQVVFESFANGQTLLYSVPVDGSSTPVLLFATSGTIALNSSLKFSADSTRLAFLADDILRTVPLDGSTPAASIQSAALADFRLSPDGDTVVFRRQTGLRKIELFAAPSDGSAPPRALNPPFHSRAHATAFELTPDGSRVVYLADQILNEMFELFSVPLDGSAPAVRLSGVLATEGDVRTGFALSSDGQRVVYLADALVDERVELFSVRTDAQQAPVRLSGALPNTADVQRFTITPDANRVVYLADARSDGVLELFSTPIRGARVPKRLSRPLVPGGQVIQFQVSADSHTVVFMANRSALPDEWTVLAAPIDQEDKAVDLIGPFTGRGSVNGFLVDHDASVVAYLADQRQTGVFELFAADRGTKSPVSQRR